MKFSPKIYKAIDTAARLHDGQKRKSDGLPYIIHPFAVALMLLEHTDDEDIVIAGILHDTIEDTDYTKELMEEAFGPQVADFVSEVTELPKTFLWQERKDAYLKHLVDASYGAKLICSADKLHNLRSMSAAVRELGDEAYKRFNAPADKQLWFYDECCKILAHDDRMPRVLIDALRDVIVGLGGAASV